MPQGFDCCHVVSTIAGRSLQAAVGQWLLVVLSLVVPWHGAAETNQVREVAPDPTDISLATLIKMEVPTVQAASKYEQKITEAPSAVTIITAEEIQRYGYQTLADVLRSVRGLHVSYNRQYEFLGMRGFNRGDFNSRVLLLVNGHRVNNTLSDGALIGTAFILDVDLIDRVEVIRGPGSVLYGNNAFFGVINVITRRGRDFPGFGAEVSGELASYDTTRSRVTYGTRFKNDVELLLSGTVFERQGAERLFFEEFDTPADNHGIAEHADGDQFQSFFGSLGYRDFTLEGAFISREKVIPTAPFGSVFNTTLSRATDERGYVTLEFKHEFPDVVDVHAQVYYDRQNFEGEFLYPVPLVLNREEQVGEWWGSEIQLSKTLFERHKVAVGAEYRDDFRQERRNFDIQPPSGILGENQRDTESYGVYFQGDFAVLTNLHFTAGVRYDQYGLLDPTVNPRLALIYNPVPGSTLKAIYGTAFRAPNFFERIFNPDLDPETITTYELVYEQQIGKHLRSSLSAFFNEVEDLITFEGGTYNNLDGAEVTGVSAELQTFWRNGIEGRVSYTFQETEDRRSGRVLTDSPRHLAKLNLSAPLWSEKVFAGLEFQYTSKRRTLFATEAPGFGVVNFTLFSRKIVKGLEASASIYNLLDQDYGDPATPFHRQDIIPQNGRNFRVKLTYHF